MSTPPPDLFDHAEAVAQHYDADVYLYSGPVDDSGFAALIGELTQRPPKKNCLLILTTNGGSANSAYQIARLVQKNYSEFILFTPSACKSAGTLIALGAHRLIMDHFSELGPLDVQLPSPDDIFGSKSGLLTKAAFENLTEVSTELYEHYLIRIKQRSGNKVSFRLASDIATTMTTQLLSKIYEQINPDVLGTDFRDLNVAMEYGKRLARHSQNPKPDAINTLVRKYPSHDFIIDDEEARSLFQVVERPHACLYNLIRSIADVAYGERRPAIIMRIRRPDPAPAKETISEEKQEVAAPGTPPAEPSMDDRGPPDQRGDQGPSGDGKLTRAAGKNGQRRPARPGS